MRKNRFVILLGVIASSFLLLSAQGFDEDQQAIIDEGVEILLAQFVNKQKKRCWDDIVDNASRRVDSLVRAEAIGGRVDAVEKPDRPNKPSRPALKQLPDSLNHGILRKE
jgi:hypothetical protein